uniref:LPD23 domain-containing protein n=1 Tax=Candidatus Scatomorpha intestinigallinarum TaxID=2840923 RepID=UPI0040286792
MGKALYWIPAGLDQFGSGIRQLFQREAVPVSSTQITSQLIQQEAQEKSPVLGTLYTLGTTLSNMAPSILASALGSWALGAAGLSAGTAAAVGRAAGGTALGASAGGNAYTQKLNEGYSSEAARNYATLVGASEGALQYLLGGIGALSKSGTGRIAAKIAGLDNALGRVARTVSGSTAARLLGSMISEGTEEGLQELLEPAFAAIIFDEEYEADFEDAAYAFLLGALSAGIIEGPAAIAYARRPAGFSFRDMDGYADNGVDYFEGANTLEEVEALYRDLARQYHPDLGGDAATMAEINRQRTMARAFFRGRAEVAAADEAADTTPEAAANTERADGVIRRLTAGRTTEETTPETAGAQIEDQIYAEAGGIVLPTADTAGDFSPRVEVGATETPTLEAPRAAVPETNAAGNIVLPTADEIMNGGILNGQQGQQWQQWGDQVSDGDGGRLDGISTGGQAGRLGGSSEVRSAPVEQGRAAIERQNRARDLRLQEVSSAELGIPEGTDTRNVRVLPETDWDDELVSTAERVRSVTGREVRYVLGSIEVRTAGGGTHRVRGVWMPNGDIIVQADNMRVSAQQIAEHEIYHDIAAQMPGTDYEVEERIREQFGAEEFERVVEIYIQKLHGIVDLPANASEGEFETALARIKQEIFADAYAGINAFGAHAERFADVTRETVKERTGIRSRENDDATRDRTGPPAERYSYAGTNAANADLEALEVAKGMAEQNVSAETIRQATGWFQGADGKWRFEIDDSGMRYSARGDLNYGDPDYWRYRELLDKLEREMLGTGSEAVTEAERAEYEELAPRYRDFYLQPGVRGDGSATATRLSDYIQHDELFEQYPQLRDARLVFEDMEDGKQGSYNPDTNTITLSESLQNSERDALYDELYSNEWFRKLLDLERRMDDIPGEYRAMYSNTSGEIEARDAEARRKLTADERRAAPPDLGNEDTIFAQSGAGVQASIDYDTDNRPYVTVEEDILDGVPERDWARTVKAVLREKFPDGITVGNSEINIGGRTGRELTWSGTSRWLRANDPVAFADKYRTANNADELLLASTDYVNEGLDHPRRDDITDFSRGKVQFRIGDRDYTADVIVAALKDGRLMLYDITHLTRTEIQNRSQPRRSTNPSPGTASYTATDSDNSISAEDENVNARFSVGEDDPRPVTAKQDLRRRLLDTFSVPSGSRGELGRMIEAFADKLIRSGRYTEQDRKDLFDKLYDAGAMDVAADPYYAEARNALVNRRMYVNDAMKAEFGDDWNDFRKRAFAAGIYLTNDPNDMSPDMWQAELGETLPGLFDADNLDMRSFMERVVQVAEEGRNEQVSLAEYTQMLANENYVSEDQALADLEQRVDWELRSFAEKADLEVRLRGRGADGISNTERKRIIQEERANYWQLHKQYQEETRRRIAEERGKRHASEREAREKINNIIREEREKYWQKRRDYQQRADERVRQERERRWAVQAETRRRIDDVEQGERRTYYERLERYKEARRATDARERERRKAMSERRRETAELRSLQQRTLKQIQWLAKNQYRAPAELKQQWDEVLGDLDIFAVSAANEMNYSKKYDATWRDLAEMYKKARDSDPNFLPSQELERIVARLDNDKIGDLDIGALQDLYKAAVGLRQEFYNRNHVIGDEEARLFSELYADSKEEINSAPGGYSKNPADKVFNLEQLTPMNYLERMAGWNPDSAWYSMAKQLEAGERNERAYIVQANALLADWLEENEEWVLRSDGQGKDAVWYEVEVPELLELGMGDKPVFGDSVKVWMTPSMKVHLYLESKNYDNLRHMVGGRTFPDKELYSDGKRQEAFAQGKTIRLAPETVKKLVSDLAPEERELAALLERYYNQFAAERINKVSNALYGYDRAVTKNYAPIYTNSNYNQKEIGKFDQTAEGVGNLKQRIRGAKNPSYNLSAYDAFERHVD